MFEFKRLFRLSPQIHRQGLTGGEVSLLELLDLNLLSAEGAACDLAAGREPAEPHLRLRQARVWREAARRGGDIIVLRRAASAAERAALIADANTAVWSAARLEQGLCAMLGAELFGDDGLNAAASAAFADAIRAGGATGAIARSKQALIATGQALAAGDALQALAELTAFDLVNSTLKPLVKDRDCRLALADARLDRAAATLACARALKDDRLAVRAIADIAIAVDGFDAAYEPLTVARAWATRAQGLVVVADLAADAGRVAEAVEIYSRLFDAVSRDHSPLDWARAQLGQGLALQTLADAAGKPDALRDAERAFDRALHVLVDQPALLLRAETANARAICRVRGAQINDDPMALDEAEAVFRLDLARCNPHRDPIGWALAQLSLARVYQTRVALSGRDRGERAKAAVALDAAMDVFSEHGRKDLAELAEQALKGLASV